MYAEPSKFNYQLSFQINDVRYHHRCRAIHCYRHGFRLRHCATCRHRYASATVRHAATVVTTTSV